jgi:hypothetical protein
MTAISWRYRRGGLPTSVASEWLERTVVLQPEYGCRGKGTHGSLTHSRISGKLTNRPFRVLCGSKAQYLQTWCLWARTRLNTFLESIHFLFLPDRQHLGEARKSRNGQKESVITLFVGRLMPVIIENLATGSTQILRNFHWAK